jgi:ABC-type dipeptide/oligopeptide/nickel transport system permease subunit
LADKKPRKDRYKDYLVSVNEKGRKVVTYTGKVYKLDLGEGEKNAYKFKFLAGTFIIFVSGIYNGLTDTTLNRVMYVAVPLVITYLPLAFLIMSVYKIVVGVTSYSEREYNRTVRRLTFLNVMILVFSAIGELGAIAYLISAGSAEMNDVLYGGLAALMGLSAFYLYKLSKKYAEAFI